MLFSRPKTVLRVNTNKISREKLIQSLQRNHKIFSKKTEYSSVGIQILEKDSVNLYKTREFLSGFFEAQAEACQLSLLKLKPHENDKVLDFRCNLAEKSLALGSIHPGISIYLYEEKEKSLEACRKSFSRNQIHYKVLEKHENTTFDWVLVEIPSSESGLLREKPELKMKFSNEALEEVLWRQRKYLDESVGFLKPKTGKLVVFSNSVLKEVLIIGFRKEI